MVFCLKKYRWLIMGFFALFLFCLIMAPLALAASTPPVPTPNNAALDSLDLTAQKAHIAGTLTVQQIVGRIINLVLGFLGVLFLVLVIYGGMLWMTAGGNEEKIKKGRDLIVHASIGLAIILFAFLLTNFVIFKLADVATSTNTATTTL